jgi:hypothetical protein
MNQEQMFAIKCAYADLQGSLEAHSGDPYSTHCWEGHRMTIHNLETTFPELTQKPYTVEVCFGFKKQYLISASNQAAAFELAENFGNSALKAELDKVRETKITNIYEVPNA